MKNQRIFPAFIIFLVLLIGIFILLNYYSKQVSIRKDGYFEISSRVKGEYNKAAEIKNRLEGFIQSQVVIEKADKNLYNLVFGKYTTTYDAGNAAFSLFLDSLLTNYRIQLDGKDTLDVYGNTLFVAKQDGMPSLFSINLPGRKISPVWSDWGEDVVSLDQSPNMNNVFFLTVNGISKKGSLGNLNDARLYNFYRPENRVKMIDYLKNGVQYYSYWSGGNRFMMSFTRLDSASNQSVTQNISVYDTTAEKIKSETRTYNLLKEGFPNPPKLNEDYTSEMNKYAVFVKKESDGKSGIYIKKTYTTDEFPLVKTGGELKSIAWSSDDTYLFFIYSDITQISKKQSKKERFLIIYDADSKKIIRKFDPQDFRSISVQGRLLIIETGSGSDSKILFYDYKNDKPYYALSVDGGCAIKNLPLSK